MTVCIENTAEVATDNRDYHLRTNPYPGSASTANNFRKRQEIIRALSQCTIQYLLPMKVEGAMFEFRPNNLSKHMNKIPKEHTDHLQIFCELRRTKYMLIIGHMVICRGRNGVWDNENDLDNAQSKTALINIASFNIATLLADDLSRHCNSQINNTIALIPTNDLSR